jgi:hypothetical protein
VPAIALDLTLGLSTGSGGGPARNRTGLAADAVIASPVKRLRRGALLGGMAAGLQGPVQLLGGSDACDNPGRSDRRPCDPKFPIFYSAAALAGVEAGGPRTGTIRALAGPGYYVEPDAASTLGFQARVDLATPRFLGLALVASGRGAILPRYQGRTLRLGAFGLGLRIR